MLGDVPSWLSDGPPALSLSDYGLPDDFGGEPGRSGPWRAGPAGGWNAERAAISDQKPATDPLPVLIAAELAGEAVPSRPWLVPDLIPDKTVSLLYGDGAAGKSLLSLQLAVAVATGSDWPCGLPDVGPAIYLSAEDDRDELHRRLADICRAKGIDLADLDNLHLLPLAGKDAVLGTAIGSTVMKTERLKQIRLYAKSVQPRLIVLDTLADLFAGNENDRTQARQFVGFLRGLAIDLQCAVLMLAHPSLDGLRSGTGASGSTGWSNSVRARLYLERVKSEDDAEPDPDLRRLSIKKANYAQAGQDILLRWRAGVFVPDGTGIGGLDRMATERRAEEVFSALLRQFRREGRDVSPAKSPSYAPKVFSGHPNAKGCTARQLAGAMDRLLESGEIRVEEYGPVSRRRTRIVPST
ncbi:AAA family ATPase [Prosthecomicrobium hirschii]|uniref:AAA family ATPase n=1 Tax=Prosthecodimorpha hirschii TaxID=665126 RepID=UPI00222125AC|nr:AAA family ATPase [Prosthecomicrobium hirschii]MCW1840446.1 AAA family ATPase [Prosthecomicrobium hirschii]